MTLKVELNLEFVDENTDCIKFRILEGNVTDFVELMEEFDNKIINEH